MNSPLGAADAGVSDVLVEDGSGEDDVRSNSNYFFLLSVKVNIIKSTFKRFLYVVTPAQWYSRRRYTRCYR